MDMGRLFSLLLALYRRTLFPQPVIVQLSGGRLHRSRSPKRRVSSDLGAPSIYQPLRREGNSARTVCNGAYVTTFRLPSFALSLLRPRELLFLLMIAIVFLAPLSMLSQLCWNIGHFSSPAQRNRRQMLKTCRTLLSLMTKSQSRRCPSWTTQSYVLFLMGSLMCSEH